MKHYKYKEAAYLGNYKLTRQNYINVKEGGITGIRPCEPSIHLECFDGDNRPVFIRARDQELELLAKLEEYNHLYSSSSKKQINITHTVRKQLMNLGYLDER